MMKSVWWRYGAAILAVATAMLLRIPLWPLIGDAMPYLMLYPAVIFAAWYGGLGPALLATVLAAGSANYFLMEPWYTLSLGRASLAVGHTVFVVMGVVVGVLMERLHRYRHRAEEAARAATLEREQLQATLSSIGDAVVATDLAGRIRFMNGVAERLTGWSAAEVVDRSMQEVLTVVDEGTREPVRTPLDAALQTGRVANVAGGAVLIAKDGTEVPVEDSVAPIQDVGGGTGGAVVVLRDLSAKVSSDREIRRYADLLEYAPVMVREHDGRIVFWNRGLEELYGWTAEEAAGRPSHELLKARYPQPLHEIEAQLAATGHWEGEVIHTAKDGRTLNVMSRWVLHPEGDAYPASILETNTDVTARRAIEAEREKLVDELKRAGAAKDNFLAMLSHELRNPLAPITNGVQILRMAPDLPDVRDHAVGMIDRQARHLARLVDDLLDVSRMTLGQVQLRTDRVDLANIVQSAITDISGQCQVGAITMTPRIPQAPVWIAGDRNRLLQIVQNLLQNACKFTPRGGRVEVALEADPASEWATLRVRDSGIGLDPREVSDIFEAFTQIERTLDRSKGGLGLGLAIVRGLVELHGGRVEAHSEGRGKGAEFTVRLPIDHAQAGEASPVSSLNPIQRRRVLVIEDNHDAADSLRMLLELLGQTTRVAYSGAAGLQEAQEWTPDMVFCDIGLPVMDGYEVARQLRRDPHMAHTRLVALTGYGQEEDRARSLAAGFDEHLIKPAEPAALADVLRSPGCEPQRQKEAGEITR